MTLYDNGWHFITMYQFVRLYMATYDNFMNDRKIEKEREEFQKLFQAIKTISAVSHNSPSSAKPQLQLRLAG